MLWLSSVRVPCKAQSLAMPCSLTGGIGRAESFGLKFRTAPLIAVIRGVLCCMQKGGCRHKLPLAGSIPSILSLWFNSAK